MVTGKLILIGGVAAAALLFAGLGKASPKKVPPPGDNPNPGPSPAPPPPSSLQGKSADELAVLAAQDVSTYGWNSGHGVVRAFQKQYNLETGATPGLTLDDKWGPDTYNCARVSVPDPSVLPPPYFKMAGTADVNVPTDDPVAGVRRASNGFQFPIHITRL